MELRPGDPLWLDGYAASPSSIATMVYDQENDGRPSLLTVAHAVGDASPGGRHGVRRVLGHPASASKMPSLSHAEHVGHVERSRPLPGERVIRADAAVVHLDEGVKFRRRTDRGSVTRELLDVTGDEYDFTDNLEVFKVGASSGLTTGTLACVSKRTQLREPGTGAPQILRTAYMVIGDDEDADFGAFGDSGAIVCAEDLRPVGMLVAMWFSKSRPRLGVTVPLASVLDVLDVSL